MLIKLDIFEALLLLELLLFITVKYKTVFTVYIYMAVVCLGHRLNMELDLQSLFGVGFMCPAVFISWDPANTPPPPPPHIWAHIRGRYWSAKIDDNSL